MKYLDFANHIQSKAATEALLTLIDLSPSMDDDDWKPTRKAGAITANEELIRKKLKCHPQDKMGIIGFSSNARLLHPPVCMSKGANSLQRALIKTAAFGGTNFTAALELAETCFFGNLSRQKDGFLYRFLAEMFVESDYKPRNRREIAGLKRIIMLTDGEHNHDVSPLRIASRLKKAGVIIDCIGIGGSPEDVDESLLRQISSRNTDGSVRYCFIGDQRQLLRKYQSLARHIRAV